MATNDKWARQLEGVNKRLDTLTVEVVDMKSELRSHGELLRAHGELLRAMQQTLQQLVNTVIKLNTSMGQLNERVDRLEGGQQRLITLVSRIVERFTDFEAGATVELGDVEYDKDGRTLRGKIRRIAR